MIDSHAHLAMFPEAERRAALERAAEAGVQAVLVPATGRDDLDLVAELARVHEGRVFAAVGFHPHEAAQCDADLEAACGAAAGVAGCGRCG